MRLPHENVATVLVDPRVLADLELALMELDLRVWPVATAPICVDGARTAFQIRRSLVMRQRGAWDLAADWTPVWISFGASWYDGAEPLPWEAHQVLVAGARCPGRPRAFPAPAGRCPAAPGAARGHRLTLARD